MNLGELFTKYGSDKESLHGYSPIYESLFRHRREHVRRVLEIGVAEGGSLLAWADYFPNAEIIGMDKVSPFRPDGGRVRVLYGDQGEPWHLLNIWKTVGYDFDLIVDDGSHEPLHQIGCFLALRRLLSHEGAYVIEDVQEERVWKSFPELFPHQDVKLIDLRHKNGRYDNLLVIACGPR